MGKGFFRIPKEGLLSTGGVCAGLAYWIGVKAWIIRVAFIASWLYMPWIPSIIYCVLWLLTPKADTPDDYSKVCK